MFPILAHVAQAPIIRPLFVFANQLPIIWIIVGQRIEEKSPIRKKPIVR
jgi:hypothetical protein